MNLDNKKTKIGIVIAAILIAGAAIAWIFYSDYESENKTSMTKELNQEESGYSGE
jgi:hypothetical protein